MTETPLTDEPKPLTEEELAQVDVWVADCKEADLRHGVRMRRLLDELRRLQGEIRKLKELLIAAGGRPPEDY
jgi:hypothetical protein